VDKQGKLWLNGNTDLYCLSPGARIFQMRKLPYRWVIRQTADGTFWLLEETKGVRAVSGPLAETYDGSKAALRFSIGTQLLVDREGSFWISVAEQGGVRRVSKPEQLLGRTVESTSGLIQKFTHPGLPKSTAVILWTDSTDRVWFGYMGNEIALIDGEWVRTFSSADGLHVGNVLAIGGRGDHIWPAGQFGLALFDGHLGGRNWGWW
jgi:streptogramin lyase